MEINLRDAVLDDVSILQIWDQQPHVIAAGGKDDQIDYAFEIQTDADWQQIWMGEIDGRPIGVIFCIDTAKEASQYWGRMSSGFRALDIWIGAAKDLGRGYGTLMMRQALAMCFADPSVHTIIIDPLASNTKAIRFYKRMGFVFVENRLFGADDCAVFQMKRSDWQKNNN